MDGMRSPFAGTEVSGGTPGRATRYSYVPAWMEEPSWTPSVELPPDYLLELGSGRTSASEPPAPARPHDRLTALLGDALSAVTLPAPWDPPGCDGAARRAMLAVLLRRFVDQSQDPGAIGLFAKEHLRRVAQEDSGRELQQFCESFMDQSHESVDRYRRAANFKRREDYEAFHQQCAEEAQRRHKMTNGDISRCGINVKHTWGIWNDIHGDNRGVCFGGSLTLSIASVRLCGLRLPKRIGAVWSLQVGDRVVCQKSVPQRCFMHDDGDYKWSSNGGCVTLPVPAEPSQSFEAYSIVLTLTQIKQKALCSCSSKEKNIASAVVTVDDALYQSIATPDSSLRNRPADGRGNEPCSESVSVGVYHFSSLLMVSKDVESNKSGILIEGANVFCTMNCLDQEHNSRPPAVNIFECVGEQQKKAPDGEGKNVWTRDHHAAFLQLVEIMGDIDDASTPIIKAYRRRYMIHDELERVALLVAVCTRSSMTDDSSRQLCKEALEILMEMSDNVTTLTSHELIKVALEETHTKVLDILFGLEDATENPRQGEVLLKDMRRLISIILKKSDIDEYIDTELTKSVQHIADSLEKLDKRLLCENRFTQPRTTLSDVRLPKLECMDDAAQLIAKGRFVRELIDQVTDRLKRAFIFAEDANSKLVRDLAQTRIARTLSVLCEPLRHVVTRIVACLVRSPDPDPLGDTLGLLVCTYSAVRELVGVIDVNPQLHALCEDVCSCFAFFLSCWFPLCENHISTWTGSIVSGEALVAIVPGEVHFNQAPGLVVDLLNALLSVFARLLSWADPEQCDMYLVHFFCLLQRLGEAFADTFVAQGRAASRLEEWFVCLSTIRRCQEVFGTFNEVQVQAKLLDVFGDPELKRKHQQKLIAEQMRSTMLETEEELLSHIRQGLEKSFLSFLCFLVEAPPSENEPIRFGDIKVLEERLAGYVRDQLRLAADSLSTELFTLYFEELAMKAFHSALQGFMVQHSSEALTQSDVALMLQLLNAHDQQLEAEGGWRAESEEFLFKQRNRRVLAALLGQSSQRLIHMMSSENLCEPEKGLVLLVLRARNDREAKNFIRQN